MEAQYGRAVLQWLVTFALATIFGTSAFTVAAGNLEGCGRESIVATLKPAWRAMSAMMLLASTVMIVSVTSEMAGVSWRAAIPLVSQVVAQTHVGEVWRLLVPTAVALALAAFAPLGRYAALALSVLSALLMFLEALVSHSVDKGGVAVVFYFVHEAAAGMWMGGLLAFWMVTRRAKPSPGWVAGAARFVSAMAGWSVGAIVLSGAYTTYQELGFSLDRLLYSSYGRTLLIKVVAFCAVLSIGAYNRERLIPDIADMGSQRALLRNVGVESVVLGVVVLGLAALLANTPPASGHMMSHPGMAMAKVSSSGWLGSR